MKEFFQKIANHFNVSEESRLLHANETPEPEAGQPLEPTEVHEFKNGTTIEGQVQGGQEKGWQVIRKGLKGLPRLGKGLPKLGRPKTPQQLKAEEFAGFFEGKTGDLLKGEGVKLDLEGIRTVNQQQEAVAVGRDMGPTVVGKSRDIEEIARAEAAQEVSAEEVTQLIDALVKKFDLKIVNLKQVTNADGAQIDNFKVSFGDLSAKEQENLKRLPQMLGNSFTLIKENAGGKRLNQVCGTLLALLASGREAEAERFASDVKYAAEEWRQDRDGSGVLTSSLDDPTGLKRKEAKRIARAKLERPQ